MAGSVLFTVDLENWDSAIQPIEKWSRCSCGYEPQVRSLLTVLEHHKVRAVFYVLGFLAEANPRLLHDIIDEGHLLGSHGFWHQHNEKEGDLTDLRTIEFLPLMKSYGFRSPYWDTTPRPGFGSGFFFRLFPYWFVKREVERTGIFAIHPHDLMEPPLGVPWFRRIGTGNRSWVKLSRLLKEVQWKCP